MLEGVRAWLWFALCIPALVLLVGADILAWFTVSLAGIGPPLEPPWVSIAILVGAFTLGQMAFVRRDRLRAGVRLRLLLGVYLIAVYAVGLYIMAEPTAVVIRELSEEAIQAAIIATVKDFALVLTFLLMTPIVVLAAILITGVWRNWVFWKNSRDDESQLSLLGTLAALVFLTEAFALYTAFDAHFDSVAAIEYYLWHLADAIPVLKVPATLNWTPDLEFSSVGAGVRLLAYKILVILPVIKLARGWLERRGGGPDQANPATGANGRSG